MLLTMLHTLWSCGTLRLSTEHARVHLAAQHHQPPALQPILDFSFLQRSQTSTFRHQLSSGRGKIENATVKLNPRIKNCLLHYSGKNYENSFLSHSVISLSPWMVTNSLEMVSLGAAAGAESNWNLQAKRCSPRKNALTTTHARF